MAILTLNPVEERPVRQRHPWAFSGAVAGVQCYIGRGAVIDVHDTAGEGMARGIWRSGSEIRSRLFTWQTDEQLDKQLIRSRLERAIAGRRWLGYTADDAACRLVYAESDRLPGLIVDRYADYLSVQLLTQGMAA